MTRVVTDVPAERRAFVTATMEFDGALVSWVQQADGLWTGTGIFPESRPLGGAAGGGAPAVSAPHSSATTPLPDSTARSHDVDTLARTLWGEARSGSILGLKAIAAVVLNRLDRKNPARFGDSIADICLKPRQFSCWNESDPNLLKLKQVTEQDAEFKTCLAIAQNAADRELPDPTGGSDHYHTDQVAPEWSHGRVPARKIDHHFFYNDIP